MSETDRDFDERRKAARERIDALDKTGEHSPEKRGGFFEMVYETAGGDAAAVPWADLEPKHQLIQWLAENPGINRRAIDIACGLGDNAEAIAAAGYTTTAFDISQLAIDWARRRFPESSVDYCIADIFNPPAGWAGSFDLVHECYTLQALPAEMLDPMTKAIAALVAPGGILLVYTRVRIGDAEINGPPWPLPEEKAMAFANHGFELEHREEFTIERHERIVPHLFCVWRRPGEKAAL